MQGGLRWTGRRTPRYASGMAEARAWIHMSHRTCFSCLLCGFALTILDLRAGSVDLLPDSLGYILIALGAGALKGFRGGFGVARGLAWILVPLSVVGDLDSDLILETLRTLLDTAMLWYLLGGIMAFAASQGRPDIASRARNRRVACVLLTLIGLLIEVTGGLGVPLGLATLFLDFILLALILHLLYKVRAELGTARAELAF
jgi:hypothetical protein